MMTSESFVRRTAALGSGTGSSKCSLRLELSHFPPTFGGMSPSKGLEVPAEIVHVVFAQSGRTPSSATIGPLCHLARGEVDDRDNACLFRPVNPARIHAHLCVPLYPARTRVDTSLFHPVSPGRIHKDTCNVVLTVKHILIDCADLLETRKKYFEEKSLYSLFRNVVPEVVFDFLHEIGVFYKV